MKVETIYRAKKLDSDEYVEGYLLYGMIHNLVDISNNGVPNIHSLVTAIDKSTLSIHFTNSNMEDSEGTKIFASLSSDGNGGSIIEGKVYGISKGKTWKLVAYMENIQLWYQKIKTDVNEKYSAILPNQDSVRDMKVTGIHTVNDKS